MHNDLEQTAERLADWFVGRHPGAGPVRVSEMRRSESGYSSITLLAELHWRPAGRPHTTPIVLRLQSNEPSVFPDGDIERPYRVMACLAGSNVPVPPLLGHERSARVLGAPFFVMERIEGRVPDENPPYHLKGWWHELPAAERRAHWFAGIDTLVAIARIDWQGRGLGFLQPPAGCTPLAHQLESYGRALAWAESLGRPYPHLRAGYRWLLEHQPRDEPVALSWADAKLGNCIFRGRCLVAALDWEQATLANPVDDLAWWLMLDESLSTGYGFARLANLPTREETVAYWERASGCSTRDLPYYDVFAAWRMAYIMARIGTLFTQRGWMKPEAEMDIRNGGATLLARHAARLGFR